MFVYDKIENLSFLTPITKNSLFADFLLKAS